MGPTHGRVREQTRDVHDDTGAEDAAKKVRGFQFHDRLKGLLRDRVLGHGVTDETGLDVAYELIVQSLLMRVISMGSVPEGEVPYAGFPDAQRYAVELSRAVTAYVEHRAP